MLPAIVSDIPLTKTLLDRLVDACAFGIEDLRELLDLVDITPAAFSTLADNDEFKSLIVARRLVWSAVDNAETRTRIKTDVALEEALPVAYQLANNSNVAPADRLKALAFLKSMSTLQRAVDEARSANKAVGGGGAAFELNITMPWREEGGAPVQIQIGRDPAQALESDASTPGDGAALVDGYVEAAA